MSTGTPSEPTNPTPPPNNQPKTVIGIIFDALSRILALNDAQAKTLALILATLGLIGGLGYLVWQTGKSQSEMQIYLMRQSEDSREKDRQFYDTQRKTDRDHCDQREDGLSKWYREERDKDRTAAAAVMAEQAAWRKMLLPLLKKNGINPDDNPLCWFFGYWPNVKDGVQ